MDDMNIVRLSPLRPGGGGGSGLKSPSSGTSTPRGSPSFRRLSSSRIPRREGKAGGFIFSYCFRSNRILLWLLLITLWAYNGFYFQSRWAHGDNKEDRFSGGYGGESNGGKSAAQRSNRRDFIAAVDSRALRFKNETSNSTVGVDVVLAKSESDKILIDHDYYSRALLQKWEGSSESSGERDVCGISSSFNRPTKSRIWSSLIFTDKGKLKSLVFGREARRRRMSSQNVGNEEQNLKILIVSVGSKSNKVAYVKTLLTFLSTHSNFSRSVLWTPATTRVASLYAAADVYAMNSQGIGETFGRVTTEAMVFGIPVQGTDSRGTREIVEHNAIDLLHPLDHPGSQLLARNFEFLLENPSARQEMGMRGRLIWLLVALWAYAGFYFLSRWAQGDNREVLFRGVYGGELDGGRSAAQQNNRRDLIAAVDSERLDCCCVNDVDAVVAKSGSGYKLNENKPLKKKSRRSPCKKGSGKPKIEEIPEKNSTYGFLVGPYGSVEDSILEWSPEKRSGTCDWKGAFARFVWSRKFVLSFHDLSMTGAPLAMEFLCSGGTTSAIVLEKREGLMPESTRRIIKVHEQKSDLRFKTAMKKNLIIAMEFLCSGGATSAIVLKKREGLMPESTRRIIKVHEQKSDLRFKTAMKTNLIIAGSAVCSNLLEKRQSLRSVVRQEMGVTDDGVLAISFSINPAYFMLEQGQLLKHYLFRDKILIDHDYYTRALLQKQKWYNKSFFSIDTPNKMKRIVSPPLFTDKGRLKSLLFGCDASTVRAASLTADVYLMNSQLLGAAMGVRRRDKVGCKKEVFKKFGEVLYKCMRLRM